MIRLLCLLLLFATPLTHAEVGTDNLSKGITEFTAAYQAWDGDLLNSAVETLRHTSTNATTTSTNYYWLDTALFHRMLQLQHAAANPTNKAAAEIAMNDALESLTIAVKLDAHDAESQALLGTLYGMKINGSLLQALRFGPRVSKCHEQALAFGAENPRVRYLLGTCQFHTAKKPAAWRETLNTLLAAEKLFDAESKITAGPLEPRWGRSSCLTFIGRTYEMLGEKKQAADYFGKAISEHPADQLAKDGLKRVTE